MKGDINVQRSVEDILGWPTDTFAIDWKSLDTKGDKQEWIHTVLVFVPGNPGLVEWYIPFFANILDSLGPGYAVRGASYAGHSIETRQIQVEEEKAAASTTTSPSTTSANPVIPPKTLAWTIDGQVNHKIAYIDKILPVFPIARLVFVGHSIGCHLIKRILLFREDILRRTLQCVFLMPFIRMDAPAPHQQLLDLASKNPNVSMWILETLSHVLSGLSSPTVEGLLESTMDTKEHRELTANLLRQARFPRNFLGLGLEEIRDVPQTIDVPGLRHITGHYGVPIAMLFAGNDHWGPEFHIQDLQALVDRGVLSSTTTTFKYNPALKHGFITTQDQTSWVAEYCIALIRQAENPRSKL